MKTIQELYKNFESGDVSKSKFLYEARRDPNLNQFITNLTSFDDTVKILKNRGIITEAKKETKQCLTLDEANPYEYKLGLDAELGIEYQQTPKQIDIQIFEKAQLKVLSNLAKDANFYTKKKSGQKVESSYFEPVKGENFVDKKNEMKVVVKKHKANVQDTLGKKEKAKTKSGGVKVDGKNPKRVKHLHENIPSSNTSVVPFDKVQPGMKAMDDSGEPAKILATGAYEDLKRYDQNHTFDKFLSSDPTGVDANQVVAIIDGEGNTSVRNYGMGGVYVFNNGLNEGILSFSDGVKVNTGGKLRPLKLYDGWYIVGKGKLIPVKNAQQANTMIGKLNGDMDNPFAVGSANNPPSDPGLSANLGTFIPKEAIVVKADSPEADPNRLKKYTDKGLDIKLDPNIKEMKLNKLVKEIMDETMGGDLESAISNKEVPQNATEIAEAKALVLPIITKANLQTKVDLDRDVALKNGNVWVRLAIGNGVISKEQLKALCSEGSFVGANPVDNQTITLVFSKSK